MERSASSKLGHVLMLLLLLSILFFHTDSALPSDHEQISVTGRRLMSIYRPNGDIYTGPSTSGHGGGHVHQHSTP
ncbi:hypothetical protein EUTSA_v10001085mg [Eutrema salsugineum]|uniref:Uncharacterized protein n=1 Tax=Eutrema salsugineum TaxID=72664 RepID=V4L7B8_EUTSA|nr:hypothetical protein EUTSA_v10001085mg [Eutrema salsugineum]